MDRSTELLSDRTIDAGLVALHAGLDRRTATSSTRSIEFADFPTAVAFVNRLAPRCEELDHHPDLALRWRWVDVALSTHSAGGVTRRTSTWPASSTRSPPGCRSRPDRLRACCATGSCRARSGAAGARRGRGSRCLVGGAPLVDLEQVHDGAEHRRHHQVGGHLEVVGRPVEAGGEPGQVDGRARW